MRARGPFANRVRFLKEEKGVTIQATDGDTLYMAQPKVRLERGIRSWIRVLVGWAESPRRGRRFVRLVLEYLETADILGTFKRLIFAILPERFGIALRIGKLAEFSLVWTA